MSRIAAILAVLLVCVLGALLGCGPEDGGTSDAPGTTAQRGETAARTAEETSSVEPPNVAEAVTPEIDEASIRRHLSHLTGASPAPLEGGAITIQERGSERGRRAAAEYMEQSFERLGIPARILEFNSDYGRGFDVEAILEGSEAEKHLWVTAHMDSVGNAGANDNASGLTLLLMTAKALEHVELEHTVHFVAYDLEEVGLIGSYRYVRSVVGSIHEREGDQAIIGNINADMVGYEEDEWNAFLEICDLPGPLDETLTQASSAIEPSITLAEGCPQRLAGRSDHVHFREAGLPAVFLIDGAKADQYPCYHERCDTMDKLNIAYLRSMIRMVATASALLAVPE